MKMNNSGTRDLTVGNPLKLILIFAFPLMLGQLFQQLNGVMEAVIVGRYLGENTLAAVGIGGTIYNIPIQAVMGITSGIVTCVLYYMMIYLFGVLGNGITPLCMMISSALITNLSDFLLIGLLDIGIEAAALSNLLGQGSVGLVSLLYAWKKFHLFRAMAVGMYDKFYYILCSHS